MNARFFNQSKSYLNFAVCVIVSLFFFLTSGCKSDEDVVVSVSHTQKVQIRAKILSANQSMRATENGGVNDTSTPVVSTENGSANENKIRKIRVLVFDGNRLCLNKLYVQSGTNDPGDDADAGTFTLQQGQCTMTMDLPKGYYEFVLVANDQVGSFNLKSGVTDRSSLDALASIKNIDNPVKTTAELQTAVSNAKGGLCMVGSQRFRVDVGGTKPDQPLKLSPEVSLVRTTAKVELLVTNKQPDGKVYPNAKSIKLKRVELKNANQQLNLLPWVKPFPSESLINYSSTINHPNAGDPIPASGTDKFAKVFEYYMAERTGVNEQNAVKLIVTADVTASGSTSERVYTIPVYGMADAAKDYNIYRNTLYRINATVKGPDAIDVDVRVEGFEESEIIIGVSEPDLIPV